MSSSRCIHFALRKIQPCRASISGRHVSFRAVAVFSTSAATRSTASPAYVQKPDKTHPVPTNSVQPAITSQTSLKKKGKHLTKPKTAQSSPPLEARSMEEQLKEIDKLSAMQHAVGFDLWAQPVAVFDLHIPSLFSKRKDASIIDHMKSAWHTQLNWVKNAMNLWRMAYENSLPGVTAKSAWSLQIFKAQSTPWLAPFRATALQTYKDIYAALAARDEKTLKKLASGSYHEHLLKLLRAQDPSRVYIWEFVKEESPCKVVSIRAPEVNFGREPPKIGSRLLVQALVKFDTLQTLKIYNKKGTLVGGDENPRRVVEYLVFQKRMWYDTPWLIRDQLFETLDTKYTVAT